jgi:hypothetical protein
MTAMERRGIGGSETRARISADARMMAQASSTKAEVRRSGIFCGESAGN